MVRKNSGIRKPSSEIESKTLHESERKSQGKGGKGAWNGPERERAFRW